MVIIGIDPGLTGACAVLDHNGLRAVFDLPTMAIPGIGPDAMVQRKIDAKAFLHQLLQHIPVGEVGRVCIESVGTMGGKNNAVQTQGSLLRSLGTIEAVMECSRMPLEYVAPQTWKRHYGLLCSGDSPTRRKAIARACAHRLYPDCPDLARVKDHNRAEAILIAHWLMRETT